MEKGGEGLRNRSDRCRLSEVTSVLVIYTSLLSEARDTLAPAVRLRVPGTRAGALSCGLPQSLPEHRCDSEARDRPYTSSAGAAGPCESGEACGRELWVSAGPGGAVTPGRESGQKTAGWSRSARHHAVMSLPIAIEADINNMLCCVKMDDIIC
ncbi:hypothetical protein PoB_001363500 [Plakobranchus ocellatus]|uniref:Uncharacterized protein n=1 Tax=Plakobranchus ocellatus TaxID=259542 RepID=A0AAV3YXD2_9GAST|nr:hypothetical protein PoB_001363500 [Plakobranchus ocellatus]